MRSLKTKLTHIGSTAREVSDALDILRAGVLRSVRELESQLAVVEEASGGALSAWAFTPSPLTAPGHDLGQGRQIVHRRIVATEPRPWQTACSSHPA